jgi:predicted HTH domain antitoxin
MKSLIFDIPEELLLNLKIPKEYWKSELKKELAIHLYREGFLSFGNSRRLAEMNKWDFHNLLGNRKIPRQYTDDDFQDDLKQIESM